MWNPLRLLAHWRARNAPVVVVRHDSLEPNSVFRPGRPGNALKPEVRPLRGEVFVGKNQHSAFIGTELEAMLRKAGTTELVVCGIQTNFCCETTARIGSDLGYDVWFVLDATHTFDSAAPDGEVVPAAEIARMTAINLQDEFAEVVTTTAACARRSDDLNAPRSAR